MDFDATFESEAAMIEYWRRLTPSQRLEVAMALTNETLRNSRKAIREAHPNASEDELKVIFVETHYGRELAEKFRDYLLSRNKP